MSEFMCLQECLHPLWYGRLFCLTGELQLGCDLAIMINSVPQGLELGLVIVTLDLS